MRGHLFIAEADRIQQFLYRSAHLREVIGASQLLTRFCDEAIDALGGRRGHLVFADGGKFEMIFGDRGEAESFGEDLSELYRMTTDSTLTFAVDKETFEYSKDAPADAPAENGGKEYSEYQQAVERTEELLRRRKRSQRNRVLSPAQGPHWVICEACGTDFACRLQTRPERIRLCQSCSDKTRERVHDRAKFWDGFLGRVRHAFPADQEAPTLELPWVRESASGRFKDAVELLACYDPVSYVAYLVADGNNMGRVFSQCRTPQRTARLSSALRAITLDSLAAPIPLLRDRLKEVDEGDSELSDYLPAYPLYVGGDDVFALLPAAYAVDFAVQFCRHFETRLGNRMGELSLDEPAGISAAVVICKSKYPYSVARRHGERLLRRQAKHLVKSIDGGLRSSIAIGLIVGNELGESVQEAASSDNRLRSLGAFWVDPDLDGDSKERRKGESLAAVRRASVEIDELLLARYLLRKLPQTRRVQLDQLLNTADLANGKQELEAGWKYLRSRVGRDVELGAMVDLVAQSLGLGERMPECPTVRRGDEKWDGHGLLDLLQFWDYLFQLWRKRSKYQTGGD